MLLGLPAGMCELIGLCIFFVNLMNVLLFSGLSSSWSQWVYLLKWRINENAKKYIYIWVQKIFRCPSGYWATTGSLQWRWDLNWWTNPLSFASFENQWPLWVFNRLRFGKKKGFIWGLAFYTWLISPDILRNSRLLNEGENAATLQLHRDVIILSVINMPIYFITTRSTWRAPSCFLILIVLFLHIHFFFSALRCGESPR